MAFTKFTRELCIPLVTKVDLPRTGEIEVLKILIFLLWNVLEAQTGFLWQVRPEPEGHTHGKDGKNAQDKDGDPPIEQPGSARLQSSDPLLEAEWERDIVLLLLNA